MGNVNVLIRTMDDVVVPAPISGAMVRIFDENEVFVVDGTTGGTGEVNFTLAGDGVGIGYTVRPSKVGVSFPPNNEFPIIVTDPPAPPNEFELTGHIGLVGQVVKIVVQDDEVPTPNPVEGVNVRLFDSGDLFLTEATTPASGELSMVLPGAVDPGQQYVVRLFPPAGSNVVDGPTQYIYVLDPLVPPDTNVFDFVVVEEEVPVTGDPLYCRLTGYIINAAGIPLPRVEMVFRPREGYPNNIISGFDYSGEPTVIGGKIVAAEYRVVSDDHGYFDLNLPRRAVFDVHVTGLDQPFTKPLASVWIPDLAGIALVDVLFSYITQVTFDSAAISLLVGETLELEVTLESTNHQENLSGVEVLNALLSFQSSDQDIALVSVTSEGKILVEAKAAGSATIDVERLEGTVAPRRPEVPDLFVLPSIPTITVT